MHPTSPPPPYLRLSNGELCLVDHHGDGGQAGESAGLRPLDALKVLEIAHLEVFVAQGGQPEGKEGGGTETEATGQ